jgi:predicted Zn-ribbon and HTH transcriptional regulator
MIHRPKLFNDVFSKNLEEVEVTAGVCKSCGTQGAAVNSKGLCPVCRSEIYGDERPTKWRQI